MKLVATKNGRVAQAKSLPAMFVLVRNYYYNLRSTSEVSGLQSLLYTT